jgi:hypothetical protein
MTVRSIAIARSSSHPRRPAASRLAADAVAVAALAGGSLALRTYGLGRHLWMDEGIAVGIAGHPLDRIPGLLRLDGSPPLYYVLLHAWMAAFGRSEIAVRWLSVLLAVACVPAALWAGTRVRDRRTGWALAVLVACSPFLVRYAQDARMYSLVVLLGLLCVGCFAGAFVHRRRVDAVRFGVALALALYTHTWALFLAVALVLAYAGVLAAAPVRDRHGLVRDGAIGFGLAAVLYAPWVPTVVFQARHTGAPWATTPTLSDLGHAPAAVMGGWVAVAVVGLAVIAAIGVQRRAAAPSTPGRSPRVLALALAALAVVPVLLGWALSQRSPAWDTRYLAVVVAPALALAALGIARAGRAGVAILALLVALWVPAHPSLTMGNAAALAAAARPQLRPGDLVVSEAIGQVPLLAYELRRLSALRYATPLGAVRDTGVVDWRDAAERLARTSTRRELEPLLAAARIGSRLLLVAPRWDERSAETSVGRSQRRRASQDTYALLTDSRFRLLGGALPRNPVPVGSLQGLLFVKVRN